MNWLFASTLLAVGLLGGAEFEQKFINGQLGVPTPSTSPEAKGIHLITEGDFLYWIAREEGLEYDLLGNTILFDNVMQNVDVREPEFQWSPGFRVALGLRGSSDDWECTAQWTALSTSAAQKSQVAQGNGLLNNGVWNDATGIVETTATTLTSANWWLHYNQLDIGYSRSFFLGRNLSSDLSFGLALLWIDQKLVVHAPNSDTRATVYPTLPGIADLRIQFNNDYQAEGLFLRFKPQWNFSRCWSILGSASTYIVHGTHDIEQNWYVAQLNNDDLSLSKELQRTRVGLHGSLGFQWETEPENCRWHMAICLQYEGLIWFKQNLWSQVNTVLAQNYERRGDLEIQGATLSTRFDF